MCSRLIQNDYLMRMIMQFSRAMGILIGLIRERKPEQALAMVSDLYKMTTGLDADNIRACSEQDLLNMMTHEGSLELEKILMVAKLLKEEGDICTLLQNKEEGYACHIKSLILFVTAAKYNADTHLIDYHDEIGQLVERLSRFALPPTVLDGLWRYYGSIGDLQQAENLLFELLESGIDEHHLQRCLTDGLQFYEQLLQKDDAELDDAGLPRHEISDAIQELRHWR